MKVPQGDLYIMRSILHDWPDETSVQILKNIREAITPSGKLLVIEQLLPPEGFNPAPPLPSRFLTFISLYFRTAKSHAWNSHRVS